MGCGSDLQKQINKLNSRIAELEQQLENQPKGTFYTLQEAFNNKLLLLDDIKSIAFYNNGGIYGNEEIMGVEYLPIPKSPSVLSESIKNTIIRDYENFINCQSTSHSSSATIYYLGSYNNCYAVKVNSCQDYNDVVTYVTIYGVLFIFPNTQQIVIYRNY
ncbi:MAG: hypothetical protein FWD32_02395 [Firmicutes bacterium]|nr:hypothetical protein [Bacillota bacterium]